MEEIKKIKGYGNYLVTASGNVINSTTKRVLKQEKSKGYLRVTLSENGITKRFLVHRLVAENYLLKSIGENFVNHINGDKLNNNLFNLEWCTSSENEIHSYKILGKINANRKLSKDAILDIFKNAEKATGNYKVNKGNISEYANKYNVDVKTIHNVLNKKYYV